MMGPGVGREEERGGGRPRQIKLSSPGLTGRPSTPRPLDSVSGAPGILVGRVRGGDGVWMAVIAPAVHRDDERARGRPRRIKLSSPGLTGRPSTRRPLDSVS